MPRSRFGVDLIQCLFKKRRAEYIRGGGGGVQKMNEESWMGVDTHSESDCEYVASINTEFAHTPLSSDEDSTCKNLIEGCDSSDICVMPNHHINHFGEFDGFKFTVPTQSSAACLPVTRTMFYGNTVTECSSSNSPISGDVMRLLSDLPATREKMRSFLKCLEGTRAEERASFDCIPDNVDSLSNNQLSRVYGHRSVDAQPWKPETPSIVGIYHAYVRGFNKDSREHRIYVSCSGGCPSACDAYYNLFLDVARQTSVNELCEAQETWWLRKACQRSRLRVIKMAADWFDLPVNSVVDIHSYNHCELAVPTIDTLSYDLAELRSGHFSLFSKCCDTTTNKNGILHRLHPSEGFWIMRGPTRASRGISSYGGVFGNHETCGSFPTETFMTQEFAKSREKRPSSSSVIVTRDSSVVCRIGKNDMFQEWMFPDENYIKTLESMQWNRDNGIVELMPIVVGVGSQ